MDRWGGTCLTECLVAEGTGQVDSYQVPGPVVVGITADGDNTGALVFAAGEARRLGVQVRLVHAAHQVMPPSPESVLVSFQSLEEVAELILSGARHAFAVPAPDVLLETVAQVGRPVDVLVALSEQASMLVLQHRSMSRLGRIFTGSTSVGVALRAHCPVVSVPTAWSPERRGRVTVGVDEHGGPAHVFFACQETEVRAGCATEPLQVNQDAYWSERINNGTIAPCLEVRRWRCSVVRRASSGGW